MTLAGATQQLYRLSWRIPFFGKLASSSTPGYAAFILHHQDSAIAQQYVAIIAGGEGSPYYARGFEGDRVLQFMEAGAMLYVFTL